MDDNTNTESRVQSVSQLSTHKICSKCELKHYAKGFCRKHYINFRYENDEAFKEKSIKEAYSRTKNKKATNPEFKQKCADAKNELEKKRYHSDIEFKKKKNAASAIRATLRAKRLKQATPPWVDKEVLKDFWKNRPKGHHVDHIVPIKGENVSGLNVPWNLQYLPSQVNLKKSNKF